MSSGGSRLFGAGRALGLVSDETPLVVRYIKRRKEHLVVTCVGRAFHTYSFTRLALLTTSPQHTQGNISCLAADTYHIYTAVGSQMFAWRRGRELQHTYGGAGGAEVRLMLPFGPHLVSVDSAGVLSVWDVKAEELYTEITFQPASFEITAIAHPHTYVNKVVVGSGQGGLQLWNLHKGKLVYTFPGWGSAVTVLQQAPALDVMAVGLQDGRIFLHNLKYDETITSFVQDWGCVTGLAFVTDPSCRPLMASGATSGHVVMWDLEERRVCSQVKAHAASVGGLVSLPGEPILVTSSSDNSLKVWVLGEGRSDEPPRLLRLREGHAAPPTFLRFHGADGKNLVTAGADSTLRIFSTVTETFNKSLGRASYNRKKSKKSRLGAEDPLTMPPVTQFSCESTRQKEWDDIVALHLGLPTATTWSYDKLRMGDHKLLHDRFKNGVGEVSACSVCLSRCGHFAVVGLSSGHVDRFNVQSGLHRGSYGHPTAHGGAVRGVHCHPLNRTVVTAGADAKLKIWPFNCKGGGVPLRELDLGEPCLFLRSHSESSLVALALEDFSLLVVDVEAGSVVRRLRGHGARPTDLTFSPDARWLVSAAMDCLILTWDLVSSTLVDCLQTEEACVSVSFSPAGDLLATAHVDSLGVFLWCNRALFSHVSLRPLDAAAVTSSGGASDAVVTSLPLTAPDDDDDDRRQGEAAAGDDDDRDRDDGERCRSPAQMPGGLVTLAGLASSRWQNLLSLDVIKRRNRPKESPRPTKAAPFFLPTVPSLQGDVRFNMDAAQQQHDDNTVGGDRWRLPVSLTVFGQLLLDTPETEWELLVSRLKELGPSALDLEVSSMSPEAGGSVELMGRFLRLLSHVLRSGGDFELAQAHLALFLQRHGALLASQPSLQAPLQEASVLQARGWGRLQQRLMSAKAMVAFLRNT